MSRHIVCRVEELPPGGRKIVEVRGRTVGVFNVHGTYYALLNRCPHRNAPLCLGPITGLIEGPEPYKIELSREGEVLHCPWHGWEFDITNGHSVFNPHRIRAKSYQVTVEPPSAAEADDEPDPSIETFPVVVEQEVVVLYIGQSKPNRLPAATGTASASTGIPAPVVPSKE
jgi:3-phenylpropionate/trans-cinnamate dioxygenase ferredoxin subunit